MRFVILFAIVLLAYFYGSCVHYEYAEIAKMTWSMSADIECLNTSIHPNKWIFVRTFYTKGLDHKNDWPSLPGLCRYNNEREAYRVHMKEGIYVLVNEIMYMALLRERPGRVKIGNIMFGMERWIEHQS